MKKIKHVSSSNQSLPFPFSMLNHQVPGSNASHNGGGDQSDCHHLGNSSRGRGEPNKVLFSHQFLVPVSLQGTHLYCGRQRSLSGSYDFLESNRGGKSQTFCSTFLFSVEAFDQPLRKKHSYETQGCPLHPPPILCQRHVQLRQGHPQRKDPKQVSGWCKTEWDLISRICIHKSLDELVENVCGVERLPEEYGGSVPMSTMARWASVIFLKSPGIEI